MSAGKGTQTALYVGETHSLKERIPGHEKWPCVNKHRCTHIAVHTEGSQKRRREIESDLIVIDAFSRKVLAIGFISGEPNSRFAASLLRRAIRQHGAPIWLVSDKDRAFRNKLVNARLRNHGIRRRYGAVGRKGSIAIIERMWRSMKQEYVRQMFLYLSTAAIEKRLQRWARWHNAERPHQGLGQRTPNEVYRGRPPKPTRNLTAGTLSVRFLDGDSPDPAPRTRSVAPIAFADRLGSRYARSPT